MLAALSPARRRVVVTVAVLGAALVLVLGGVLLVRLTRTEAPASGPRLPPQDRPGPVLLVPGYGGSVAQLSRLADVLRAHGKDVTVVPLPDGGHGDLRVQARTLAEEADAALGRSGAPSVDVIGYSAGGVVARYWLQDLDGRTKARRVVTLGSPHHGTEVADLGALFQGTCPVACQQLRPDSELLAALDRQGPVHGPKVVSVWTTHDDVVLPPDSARLMGALDLSVQEICPGSTVRHGGLPADPLVQRIVLAQLGSGPPTPLGPRDCRRLSS